jgi:iron complex outermembrane receptor protein
LELDGQVPVVKDRLSLAVGASAADETHQDGRSTNTRAVAIIPTLSLGDARVTAFWSAVEGGGDVPSIMVTRGARLPPVVQDNKFYAQDWVDESQKSQTYGLIGRTGLGEGLELRLGAFESRFTRRRGITDLFLDVQPDGSAVNVAIAEPALPSRWTSGEARLSWNHNGSRLDHAMHLSFKARDKELQQGAGTPVTLGPAIIGRLTPYPKPAFVFSRPTINAVEQWTVGAAYIGRWFDRLELNFGLQSTHYQSTRTRNDISTSTKQNPLLYNGTVAYAATPWLAFYGGITKGLEETGGPPSNAVNRDQAVPASRTSQLDGGVRMALGPIRVVLGAFEIERSYFSLDTANIYTALGQVRNRGIEASITGQIADRLSFVGGLVLLDARVTGEAVESGRAGKRPTGSSSRTGRLDLDYRTPFLEGLSLTAGIQHSGPTIASTLGHAELGGEQLKVDGYTIVDFGSRYRFNAGKVPMSLRLLLANAFDDRGYLVLASNTFGIRPTRRFTMQLSADF